MKLLPMRSTHRQYCLLKQCLISAMNCYHLASVDWYYSADPGMVRDLTVSSPPTTKSLCDMPVLSRARQSALLWLWPHSSSNSYIPLTHRWDLQKMQVPQFLSLDAYYYLLSFFPQCSHDLKSLALKKVGNSPQIYPGSVGFGLCMVYATAFVLPIELLCQGQGNQKILKADQIH